MLRKLLLAVGLLSCVTAGPLHADERDEELAELKKRVAALEREVEKLKSQLAEPDAELEQEQAEQAIPKPKAFGSAVDILKALPDDLQPKGRDSWDKYTVGKVVEWLQKAPVGERFEAREKVGSVRVRQNFSAQLNTSQPEWIADITIGQRDYKYRGVAFTQEIYGYGTQPLSIYGDEQLARSAEKIKAGQLVRVSAKIRSVSITPEYRGRRRIQISLVDYVVDAPQLKQDK